MSFDKLRGSRPAARPAKNGPVFAAGWHVYVNCPQQDGEPARSVPLLDGSEIPSTNHLADGQEVDIVSWRPRSRAGAAYQIRRLSDDSEWWIAAVYLRRLRQAPPTAGSTPQVLPVPMHRGGE